MHDFEGAYAAAFNLGADARLAGFSARLNPYNSQLQKQEFAQWRRGWIEVDQHWGEWATWPVDALPEVIEEVL